MNKIKSNLLLVIVFFLFVFYYAHLLDNLLSYDEKHYSGKDTTIGLDEKQEKNEKPFWLIVIDLDHFQLSVYKDDMHIRTFPCSGGTPSTPSPTGVFKVITKEAWGEGFGGAWLGLDVPWGCYGIHGTKFPWIIGKKHASKGCIRLLSKDAKELFMMVPYGTPVKIVQEDRPFRALQSGDIGPDVRDVEIALYDLGYYKGQIDGKFGNKLFDSVLEFQEDHKLWPSGIVDKKTYDLIMQIWNEC